MSRNQTASVQGQNVGQQKSLRVPTTFERTAVARSLFGSGYNVSKMTRVQTERVNEELRKKGYEA